MESDQPTTFSWLNRSLSSFLPKLNIETLLISIILMIAVISRFYNLGARVMSHDEVNHVVPSWELYQGHGYSHDPVTHGPMQFHLIALSYFLLGDNDFSSRTPSALFSIATVAFVIFGFRKYLGRSGALIGGLLFLISPFFLFYGRYARNEAFVGLFGVLTLYAILHYLEKGDRFSLFLLTITTSLQFCTKETSYIYTAQMLIFLAVIFFSNVLRAQWKSEGSRYRFLILVMMALLLLVAALAFGTWNTDIVGQNSATATSTDQPAIAQPLTTQAIAGLSTLAGCMAVGIMAIVILIRSLGWEKIRAQRSFDLLILIGTLILPLGAALPIKILGWNPLDYSNQGIIHSGIILIAFTVIGAAIGLWWQPRLWLSNAAVFYGIFIVLYTTVFTNGQGFFTGLVGSLGYWLEQQGVQRGSQPLYYYALIQMPIYEFLGLLGSILAIYFGIRYKCFVSYSSLSPAVQPVSIKVTEEDSNNHETVHTSEPIPILALFVYWSFTSLIAYSIAGEKMPWITVHIALPFLLTAAWGLGFLVDKIPWKKIANQKGLLALIIGLVFITSLGGFFGTLLSNTPPFQGNTLEQLKITSTFILSALVMITSGAGLFYLLKDWEPINFLRFITIIFFSLIVILTIRTSYRASFINYDRATEYLVYAHAASGPKELLKQVEEISRRTTRGLDIVVAYDNDGLYPYWWYLRNYPNHRFYKDQPTRDLRDVPLIIASETDYGKLDSIVKDAYVSFEYMRLWWPNQDYWNLTWDRIKFAITNPDMRTAIFNIWLNRDYTLYATITNNNTLTLENWQPANRMRLYVRKDIISQMWTYGVAPVIPEETETDPYLANAVELPSDQVIGSQGNEPGFLKAPRGIAVAPDGSIYVADSQNHRIQHFAANGETLQTWGSYNDNSQGNAPSGTFNEPWGVAVGPDGSVYVSDTWNHRIQKFTADGQFLLTWGFFGQGETGQAMWGPRGIAVDDQGRVYVTDTGNKRVVIFNENGEYISQFGSVGVGLGELDEPVGIALDSAGNVYLVDTWNQRIQVFTPDSNGLSYVVTSSWDIYGWFGQSLDNKPFIAVDSSGHVFTTDPEGYRVLEFDASGHYIRSWGDFSPNIDGFGLPSGIAVDHDGDVWVSDAGNHHLLHFALPSQE